MLQRLSEIWFVSLPLSDAVHEIIDVVAHLAHILQSRGELLILLRFSLFTVNFLRFLDGLELLIDEVPEHLDVFLEDLGHLLLLGAEALVEGIRGCKELASVVPVQVSE